MINWWLKITGLVFELGMTYAYARNEANNCYKEIKF